MLSQNKINILLIFAIISLVINGCSYKNYRNKPSIFLPTKNTIKNTTSNVDSNLSMIEPYCMDHEENILIGDMNKTEYGKCDGYYIVDASKIINITDETAKKKTVETLLLLSNDNCRRFVDKFYYHDLMGKNSFKILGLDIFNGIGISLGGLEEFTTAELISMHNILQANLKYRSKLRKLIYDDKNASMPYLLEQIREYDHACGLLVDEERLSSSDTNTSK